MARKRLNKKFLILAILPVVMIGLLLGAWMIVPKWFPQVRWLVHGTPAESEAKAKAAFDAGDFQEAANKYSFAIYLKGVGDAPLFTALGDSYYHLVLKEQENLLKAKQCWDSALVSDPRYIPALERIMKLFADDARELSGNRPAQQWDAVESAASRVLTADPNHREAKLLKHGAVIQRWVFGAEVSQQHIDEAMEALMAMSKEANYNANTMFYATQALIKRASVRLSQNDRPGATEVCQQALKYVEEILAAHQDDALTHYRAGQAMLILARIERAMNQQIKYADRIEEELTRSANMVKPDHPMYVEMKLYLAKQHEFNGKLNEAEAIYRELIKENPQDLEVRIGMSELIGRITGRRPEAIKLLQEIPPLDMAKHVGIRALVTKRLEIGVLYNLINLKLDNFPQVAGRSEQEALLKEIEENYSRLTKTPGVGETPLGLQTRGRIELIKGQAVQAVQTLSRANNLMPAEGASGKDLEMRSRLMLYLAEAYNVTGQTGEAKNLLAQIVDDFPKHLAARVMLAQLLIKEGNGAQAKPHVEAFAAAYPNTEAAMRLTILTLDREKDKAQIDEIYQKLPVGNRADVLNKVQIATYLGRRDDAIKLLEGLRIANSRDIDAKVSLARLYSEAGDKPLALRIVDEALAAVPGNASLRLLRAEIEGSDVGIVQREIIERETDPFRKAMLLYERSLVDGKPDEATQYLNQAAALKPDDGRVLELMFNRALLRRDWVEATKYGEMLGKQNRDMVDGLLYRVRVALAQGELERAADLANQIVQRMSEFGQSYVVLGQVQKAQKKYPEAIQSFETALQRQAQNYAAVKELIEISYLLNDSEKARAYIERGRRIFPSQPELREMELAHEVKYGDPEKVIAPRQEMLKDAIAAKNPAIELKAWLALGNAYLAAGRAKEAPQASRPFLEKARDTLVEAMTKFPDEREVVNLYADTTIQLRTPAEGEKAIIALGDRPVWQGKPEPALMLAAFYSRTGKPAEYEKVLRDYLTKTPNSVPVQLQLSGTLAGQKKLDEALKVLESNADAPEIRQQRIELLINDGRIADAERELRTVLASTTTPSPVMLIRQAYVHIRSGRSTEALQILDKVLAQNPGDVEALFFRSTIYLNAGRNLQRAVQDLQMVRDNQFKPLETRMMLAEAYRNMNEPEAAISELENAVRLFPTAKPPRLRLLDFYAAAVPPKWSLADRMLREARNVPELANDVDLMHAEALAYLQRKDTTRAGEAITRAMRQAPDNMNLVRTYMQILADARDYRNLLTFADRMVQAKRVTWWVYQYRGRAKKGVDDRAGALDDFTAGIDLASAANDDNAVAALVGSIVEEIGVEPAKARIFPRADRGESRWQLMMAYLEQRGGDIRNAVTWAERVANDPNAKEFADAARKMLGTLYLSLTPPESAKAVAVYRKLLERDPNDLLALNNLACTMILPGSGYTATQALEYSTKAYRIVEQTGVVNPYIYDTQGQVLVMAGRIQEGITLLQQAIDKEPIPEACLHMAEAYLALPTARPAEAVELLKQAKGLQEAAARDNKAVDAELKSKIDKTLERAEQALPPKPL